MPRAADAAIPLADLIATIPGTTSVYVRTMDERAPLASVRVNEPFSAASTIKLAIMLTAYKAYESGTATPHTLVKVNPGDLVGGSPSLGYARIGQRYPLAFLIKAMIQQSDNGASNMLISHFGFAKINETIKAGVAKERSFFMGLSWGLFKTSKCDPSEFLRPRRALVGFRAEWPVRALLDRKQLGICDGWSFDEAEVAPHPISGQPAARLHDIASARTSVHLHGPVIPAHRLGLTRRESAHSPLKGSVTGREPQVSPMRVLIRP